jgi:hypothetical protein
MPVVLSSIKTLTHEIYDSHFMNHFEKAQTLLSEIKLQRHEHCCLLRLTSIQITNEKLTNAF